MNNLHDADPQKRFLATTEFLSSGNKVDEKWPRACWGSANAWIILVGPSPGAPRDPNNRWPGGPNRPEDDYASISLQASLINFADGKGRNERWMSLVDAFTGDRKLTEALRAVCNLDWGQKANQNEVKDEYLLLGLPVLDKIIRKTEPRIVAAMTVKVWNLLSEFYRGKIEMKVPCCGLKRNPLRLRIFEGFDTFLIKTRHPSRPISKLEKDAYRQFAKDHLLATSVS